MRHHISLVLCAALLLAGWAIPAQAITLTSGRIAKFADQAGTNKDRAILKFVRDSGITAPVPIPSCPNQSSIRLVTDQHDIGVVPLGCNLWRPIANGFKYADKDGLFGGVQKILLRATPKGGVLAIKLKGDNYGFSPIGGPVEFIEAHLKIDQTEYCGRFEIPPSTRKRNDPAKVTFKGPSVACVP